MHWTLNSCVWQSRYLDQKRIQSNGMQRRSKIPSQRRFSTNPVVELEKLATSVISKQFPRSEEMKMLATSYRSLNDEQKRLFFQDIGSRSEEKNATSDTSSLAKMQQDKYNALFTKIHNFVPNNEGLSLLINMRQDVLGLLDKSSESPSETDSTLTTINKQLKFMLTNWVGLGFLRVKKITSDSSMEVFEKISHFETVHPIQDIEQLFQRLNDGRMIYAFFHPNLPDVPLAFVSVALTKDVPSSMEQILGDEASEFVGVHTATTCVFYSINSTQKGLTGVELGNYLIKRVVEEIQQEFPNIRQFVTLSPVPKFCRWVSKTYHIPTELKMIAFGRHQQEEDLYLLQQPLLNMCKSYLLTAKRGIHAADPVCNFHLQNGASLHRINWMADMSQQRLKQSMGIMVNYMYELDKLEENAVLYREQGTITTTDQFKETPFSHMPPDAEESTTSTAAE